MQKSVYSEAAPPSAFDSIFSTAKKPEKKIKIKKPSRRNQVFDRTARCLTQELEIVEPKRGLY
jgi:hypothetical protein